MVGITKKAMFIRNRCYVINKFFYCQKASPLSSKIISLIVNS